MLTQELFFTPQLMKIGLDHSKKESSINPELRLGLAGWSLWSPWGPRLVDQPSTNGPFFSKIWDESWLTLKTWWVKLYDTHDFCEHPLKKSSWSRIRTFQTVITNMNIYDIRKSHIFPYSYHLFLDVHQGLPVSFFWLRPSRVGTFSPSCRTWPGSAVSAFIRNSGTPMVHWIRK